MFGALSPSTDVDPFDAVDGRDGAVDAADHDTELSGQIVGKFSRFTDVQTRLKKEHKRKATWLGGGTNAPVGVGPEELLIGRCAAFTVDAALTRP